MNKKILEAFAKEIKQIDSIDSQDARWDLIVEQQIRLVSLVAKQFNPRFDEARFRRACYAD
jgi:hypothetical protein